MYVLKIHYHQVPPKTDSCEELSIWFCERHNEVNSKLGKKPFNCEFSNLLKRWKNNPDCGDSNIV